MPALPPVPKVVRVDHHYSWGTNPNVMIRTFLQYSGTLSVADATTWLNNIVTGMSTFMAGYMNSGVTLVSSTLTDLTSASAAQVVSSTGATGAASGTTVPEGTAVIIKKKIARRYRGGHPRVYIPGATVTSLAGPNQWNATSLANYVSAFQTYINAASAVTNPAAIGTITHVNVSFFQGFTNKTFPSGRTHPVATLRATPIVDTVTGLSGNPIPGSQRRRFKQSA